LFGAGVTPLDLVARIGRAEGAIVLVALVFSGLLPALRNHREA
jgi:hypothetical protein